MQTVNLPNGDSAQFPDTMSPKDIEGVLSQHPAAQSSPTIMDRAVQGAASIPGVQAVANLLAPVTSRINAAGTGLAQGVSDSIGDIGGLAHNILNSIPGIKGSALDKGMTSAGRAYDTASQSISQNPQMQNAIDQHPALYGLGGGIGYTAGNMVGLSPVTTPATRLLEGAAGKVLPSALGKSALAKGAISQGVLGAGMGAAASPDAPVQGAIKGGLAGAGLGAVGGVIGQKLSRTGDIIDFQAEHNESAGIIPGSVEDVSSIIKSLKDGGVDMTKYNVAKTVNNQIADRIMQSGPIQDLKQAPGITITNLAQANFKNVSDRINAAKAPLIASTQQFPTTNYQQAIQEVAPQIKSPLITKNLPVVSQNMSFDDLWNKRQQLDSVINATKIQAVSKPFIKSNLTPLIQMRQAMSNDLEASANSLGLGKNWQDANQIYQQEKLPFQAFRTKSGQLVDQVDVQQALKKVNTLLNPRISPNFEELNKVSASLGPDGQKLISQAMLTNFYKKSVDTEGNVNPVTFFTQIRKAEASGLDSNLWGSDARQAANGIKEIIKGSKLAGKVAPGIDEAKQININLVPNLIASRPGIALLRMLGSSKTPQSVIRDSVQKLITGAVVQSQANNKQP